MKNTVRQIAVIIVVLVTIIINILADALPINGLNTGKISDNFHVLFVPAGYVFAIWGLIYIGLLTYAAYQALPAQKDNPRMQATGWWVVLGGLANSMWIFLWHYELFPAHWLQCWSCLRLSSPPTCDWAPERQGYRRLKPGWCESHLAFIWAGSQWQP